jgi:glycosyltransferase involved in cell wall biosynthesis
LGVTSEVIIVDDASVDCSVKMIAEKIDTCIASSNIVFRLIENPENLGVTHAKNIGIRNCVGSWIFIVDSDDYIYPSEARDVFDDLISIESDVSLIFYPTEDYEGFTMDFEDYLLSFHKLPECLPVIKSVDLEYNFYSTQVNGFEGLGYLLQLKKGGHLKIINRRLRYYQTGLSNSISSKRFSSKRAASLALGYKNLLANNWKILLMNNLFFRHLLRYIKHYIVSRIMK